MAEAERERHNKNKYYIQLAREAGKARLTVDAGQDMQRQLLWTLDNDVFSCRIPSDHMVVFWTFK
jgi:hypothetical protein